MDDGQFHRIIIGAAILALIPLAKEIFSLLRRKFVSGRAKKPNG